MSWLDAFPGARTVFTATADLNGQPRGKRLPARRAKNLLRSGAKMPLSALGVDILGHDIKDSPLVFETGDRDGLLLPTERGPMPMPWLSEPAVLVPMWMYRDRKRPFECDPRHALARVLGRYAARGWQVVAATELEFYLIDDEDPSPLAERMAMGADILGLRSLEAHDAFLCDLYAACRAMGIAAETATSEAGAGQLEITLSHGPAMRAADDTWLFKMLAKGLAHRHGLAATFMAKPKPEDAGNGMHLHFSVLDAEGRNVFDDGTPAGSETLRQAVAGCLNAMADSTLIFAPHRNSYDRLVPGAHAPTAICWGYENRTAAVRIPDGPGAARRIEHRVSGGDINPYLMMTAVLGAALSGIETGAVPPEPIQGNAYDNDLPELAPDWATAIERFEASAEVAAFLPKGLIRQLALSKRQDLCLTEGMCEEELIQVHLDRV